jgi:hypothetical protein
MDHAMLKGSSPPPYLVAPTLTVATVPQSLSNLKVSNENSSSIETMVLETLSPTSAGLSKKLSLGMSSNSIPLDVTTTEKRSCAGPDATSPFSWTEYGNPGGKHAVSVELRSVTVIV